MESRPPDPLRLHTTRKGHQAIAQLLIRLWLSLLGWWPMMAVASVVVKPDRGDGLYLPNETVTWTMQWTGDGDPPADSQYVVKAGGLTRIFSGTVAWSDDRATVTASTDKPDALLLEVSWDHEGLRQVVRSGAVAAPDRIEPAEPAPVDFDDFWAAKLAELAAVPARPEVEAAASDRDGVAYWRVELRNIRGSRIHGQLARPAAGDRFPALLQVQWAGVYGLPKTWVTDRAAQGWLALNILPHDLPIDEAETFYEAQRSGPLKDYFLIGNGDRESSYFLRMYLSCYRAVEYLQSRPDWDGRTIVVTGSSQGGQQAFVTAGLHPDVTAALALVPAGADFNGPEIGRAAGYPFWNPPGEGRDPAAVRATGPYFDIVHFARRITCPMLVGVGLKDVVCPPAGILAAVNQLRGYHELVILPDSGHDNVNGSQQDYFRRMEEGWLPALKAGLRAPAVLDRNEDHARLREQLGITSLRSGADPGDPDGPNAPNTDEARANPFPDLPDPLVTDAGEPVLTPDQWWTVRRPEIVEHFEREVYGRLPENLPAVTWEVLSTTNEEKGGVPVLTRRLAGRVDSSAYPFLEVTIDLTLSVPSGAAGPVPVMLHFGWPPAVLARFPQAPGPTWEEQVLAHGWAAATLVPTSYQADHGEGLTRGIIGLVNRGRPRTLDQWGTLRAWAWGASRALDYLETDPAVDSLQVGIEGLSRYGKAAAVAMAFDPRFAVGFIGSSGKAGLSLHRRDFGERVENIAGTYAYHWMAGNYLKYAGPLTAADLPVDSHELIGMFAPRPAFISVGSPEVEGQWIDQRGTFLAAVAAAPVYELFEKRGLGTSTYPGTGPSLVEGELAWRQHEGGHTTLPNWPVFLDWADHYLSTPSARRWVATWVTAQQLTEPQNEPPEPGFVSATVRQKLRTSIGGESFRVRFSNVFGRSALTLDAAAIARSAGDGAIVAGSSHRLAFNGRTSVTLQPGAQWLSDPVEMTLEPMADLAVTLRTSTAPDGITGHPGSRTTSYFSHDGDPIDAEDLSDAVRVDHWYFVSGVDVRTEGATAVAVLGDSITDGRGSTTNGNDRWPDRLSERLRAHPLTAHVAVLNQGIGGNRVLQEGLGPSLLARLDRDVLAQPGVRWLILFQGINDLGTAAGARAEGRPAPGAAELIAAFDQVIDRAHDHDIRVIGATLTPFGDSFYFTEEGEADRQFINDWIRHSGRFDSVVDFDLATRDPTNPSKLHPDLHTGDHLHLNPAGLKTLADTVDLSLFEN